MPRKRRVGINSFLSCGRRYFYNMLCIPEFFFFLLISLINIRETQRAMSQADKI